MSIRWRIVGWCFENRQEIFSVVHGDNHDGSLGYDYDLYDDDNKFWMDIGVYSEVFDGLGYRFRCSFADKLNSDPLGQNDCEKNSF